MSAELWEASVKTGMIIKNNILRNKAGYILCVFLQVIIYLFCAKSVRITGDGIFTYTLSNNPYEHLFIGSAIDRFPNTNGWFSANVLREQYVATEENRFNYGMTYYHQQQDVHPIFYYFLVHTICSLFVNQFSGMFALSINVAFIIGIDILLWFIGKNYNKGHSLIFLIYIMLLRWIFTLMMYPRMYVMLAFMCLLYLYVHLRMIEKRIWRKKDLWLIILCIVMGELTHYYFYVYAAGVSFFSFLILLHRKEFYKLFNYIAAGLIGLCIGFIVYPWSLEHIIFNPQGKHEQLHEWNREWLKSGLQFWNRWLFNDNFWIALLILGCILGGAFLAKRHKNVKWSSVILLVGSNIFYYLIIATLDGFAWHYMSPIAIPMSICVVITITACAELILPKRKKLSAMLAGILVILLLNPARSYEDAKSTIIRGQEYAEFHKIAEQYQSKDCLYIERGDQNDQNVLGNLWFEFAEYDEFKKISYEEFLKKGALTDVYLDGRNSPSDVVIVYISSAYELRQENVELLMEYSNFKVYKWVV